MKKKLAILLTALALTIPSTSAFAGTWEKSTISWKYKQDDGTYTRGGWKFINGDWYYFVGSNIETSEIIYEEATYGVNKYGTPAYYVGSDGRMVKGGFYKQYDKYLNFVDSTGKVVTGFFMVDNVLYYVPVTSVDGYTINSINTTYRGETKDKFMGKDNKEHTLDYIKDAGKVLELDGNPIKSDDKFYQLIKYLPKYDSKGNFLGAIQN